MQEVVRSSITLTTSACGLSEVPPQSAGGGLGGGLGGERPQYLLECGSRGGLYPGSGFPFESKREFHNTITCYVFTLPRICLHS